MRASIYFITILFFISLAVKVTAQSDQPLANGQQTNTVTFPAGGCAYKWINDQPGIGLAASGTGNIASFTAINTGATPIVANIKATPAGYAYITDQSNTGRAFVIDLSTNAIVSTINLGTSPNAIALNQDGSRAYMANSGSLSVINTANGSTLASIPVDTYPGGVAISPDGSKVYVTNNFNSTVSVISTATNSLSTTIPLPAGDNPVGILVSADGSRIYINDSGRHSVSVINAATNTIITSIDLQVAPPLSDSSAPFGMALSPDGKKLYVSNAVANTVAVINTTNNTVSATVGVGQQPLGITVSPDGSRVYVANSPDGTVSVINAVTNTRMTPDITVGTYPTGVSVSPDGNFLYVTNQYSANVSVVDTRTNAIASTITLPAGSQPSSFGNFITMGSCSPITFKITVDPVVQTIMAGAATGGIAACAGAASASPQLQQISVSGSSLTSDITATAPAGFEISLNATAGFGNTVTLTRSGSTVNNTTIYVRSAATAPTGKISGKVTLTSAGAVTQNIDVEGSIAPLAKVDPVADQTVTTGTFTTAVNFSGSTSTFKWTNDTPGIGLAASGTGNIAPFYTQNTGTVPVVATVTVTPVPSAYGYITNFGQGTVSVINVSNNAVAANIRVGNNPLGVSLSPDGSRAYVVNNGTGNVSVINTASNSVIATIAVGSNPGSVVVSPNGKTVYVLNGSPYNVSVIDAGTNTVKATIPIGISSFGIAISPDGNKLYVLNGSANTVSVINTATNTISATVPVGTRPSGIVISPDGSRVYVTNRGINTITVINAATNAILSTFNTLSAPTAIAISADGTKLYVANTDANSASIFNSATGSIIATAGTGRLPSGISVSPDGGSIYVANTSSNSVSVISTVTNAVIKTISVGAVPYAYGNFISTAPLCSDSPVKFKITVNPLPVITAGPVSGTIIACEEGDASTSPNILQFTVSGSLLTGDITATAPIGFEVSLSPGSGYDNSVTLTPSAGTVNDTQIYVRSAAGAAAGSISGYVTLTSTGTFNRTVPVTGKINALPTVNAVANKTAASSEQIADINFTGTADKSTWTNNTPGIGLAANGTGNIASFVARNNTSSPIIATINVTPGSNGITCPGVPITFTITVNPTPVITAVGTLAGLTTTAGTPSSSTNFQVSGANLKGGVLVTPPAGFEVSTDNINFNPTATIGAAGTLAPTTVYVRLGANTPVGQFTGDVVLSSPSAVDVKQTIPQSTVTAIPPAVIASAATGNISACEGTASASPNIQQFTVSGDHLTGKVTVVAPANFQLSLSQGSGYAASLTLTPSSGILNSTIIYVRSAASAVGTIAGNVTITATGVADQQVAVTGTINSLPIVNAVTNKTVTSGDLVSAINFTGTGDTFTWTNDTPGVGLGQSGMGNIASFTAVNNTGTTVTATVTIVPANKVTTCTGVPVSFTITVNPKPLVAATGTLSALTTTLGTPSASTNFKVSGTNLKGGVLVTPPAGFEVSIDNLNFGPTVTVGSAGTLAPTTVYVRLKTADPIGQYSGDIVLSSPSAADVSQPTKLSTVEPIPPVITASTVSGFISACVGLASASPNIQMFTLSGDHLTDNITINTPTGFELSLTADAGYSNILTLVPSAGKINSTRVFVRSAASAASGSITGDITLSSTGLTAQKVAVSGFINALPVVDAVADKAVLSGDLVPAINFTGTATGFTWTNDTPGIGLAQSGDGNVPSFKATNNTDAPVTATIIVTPGNKLTGCTGTPITLTITVDPLPLVLSSGTLDGLKTLVGTASAATNFKVWGTNLKGGVLVNPPAGFEVSTDNINFSPTVTLGAAGTLSPTLVYIRLTAATPVGRYSGNVALSSLSANTVNHPTTISSVEQPLPGPAITTGAPTGSIAACVGSPSASPNVQEFKVSASNLTNDILTTASTGFEVSLTANSGYSSAVTISRSASGTVSGARIYVRAAASTVAGNMTGNVTLSSDGAADQQVAVAGTINALPVANDMIGTTVSNGDVVAAINLTGTANNFTWTNDTPGIGLAQSGSGDIPSFKAVNNTASPITATITVMPGNSTTGCTGMPVTFTITVNPSAVIDPGTRALVIPNTFTPNGDGVNDTWVINNLSNYPKCIVTAFNRWGQKIFSSIGYGTPWDGTFNGQQINTGTCYYIIDLKDGSKPLSGWVAVVR